MKQAQVGLKEMEKKKKFSCIPAKVFKEKAQQTVQRQAAEQP